MKVRSTNKTSVAVMGGGTGIYPVVSALKLLNTTVTAIVAASDSGGSTGRIRDEFGFPPVGDLRQSLAALASDEAAAEIRSLLLYRFERGGELRGHNLGNLLLTALQDMTGSTTEALRQACRIFRIDGQVIPVTEQSVQLQIHYQDGSQEIGEHKLDDASAQAKKIDRVKLVPDCKLSPAAAEALAEAQTVVIGPGDLYASLLAVLVTPGVKAALQKNKAPIIYIGNLMTRSAQTADMTAQEHLSVIENAIGKPVSHVILHEGKIPNHILQSYEQHHEYPVVDDLENDKRVIRANLLNNLTSQTQHHLASDTVRRSLLRHDIAKLQIVLSKLLETTHVRN